MNQTTKLKAKKTWGIEKLPILLREELVLVDFATTAFGSVAGPFLPFVRYDHLGKLLFT